MPAVHDISHREFGAPTPAQDQAHAGYVLLHRQLEWFGRGIPGGGNRVLRGHQRHPKRHKAGLAVTGARDFLRRPQTRLVPP